MVIVKGKFLGQKKGTTDHSVLTKLDFEHSGHTGFVGEAFEVVSKNLKSSDGEISYTNGLPTTITYSNGIVKTITYTNGLPTKIVLSGVTPSNILLTKTIVYTDNTPTSFSYS